MKKIILLIIFVSLLYNNSIAQVQGMGGRFEILDPATAGKIFRNPLPEIAKPKGSPYFTDVFYFAKVENVTQKALMRYNIYNDEFEFIDQKKNDTLLLDKIEDFNKINFASPTRKYVLVNYTNPKGILTKGYLIELFNKENLALLKKENIIFYEEKIAKTSLETNMPAKFVKSDSFYFLKNKNNEIAEFPDNKKKLTKLFPDKKTIIETFVKDNKINFSQESDLVKIVELISTF